MLVSDAVAVVQQPCSNVIEVGGKLDVERHREEIRRLVAEAPDEPTYCEFKQVLSYATRKEKGELVKDISSFANADLESVGGYGYIIFGVSDDGSIVGVEGLVGDPPSEIRQIVNVHLDRPVGFEYLTCEIDEVVGAAKRVVAIVVPDSRRRPHVVSKEIKERRGNREVFWLREREVWIRKTGGRELATAEDLDTMYEGKLRRLVDNEVRPLRERVERLEGDLRIQLSSVPQLDFGFAGLGSAGPSPTGRPCAVLNSLIDPAKVHNEIRWAMEQARAAKAELGFQSVTVPTLSPGAKEYEEYARALDGWISDLQGLLFIEFVLLNTGRAPAEDVEVVLKVPAQLRPRDSLPVRPTRPQSYISRSAQVVSRISPVVSKQTSPDSLIGPDVSYAGGLGVAEAVWEVGKLYHHRPLFTGSRENDVGGLLISSQNYEYMLSQAGGEVRLEYVLRAANVPDAVRGVLSLG